MDITETLAPTSDQLDAVDLLGGPRTFTIESVKKGNAEQPVEVHLAEFPRPWRPGKSMRRVLAACWGADASQWVSRRVRLFCDTEVRFGKDKVGGTRISHLSHIDAPVEVPLLVTRGKAAVYRVDPLRETVTLAPEQVAAITDETELKRLWREFPDDRSHALISARVEALRGKGNGDE